MASKSRKKTNVPILERQRIVAEENQTWLEKTQANILKSHGRDHVCLLFLKFDGNQAPAVKLWLSSLNLTSAYEQHLQTSKYNAWKNALENGDKSVVTQNPPDSPTVCNCYLSASGYRALGISIKEDTAFAKGLRNRSSLLNDNPSSWQAPYHDEIHILAAFANDHTSALKVDVAQFRQSLPVGVSVLGEQLGAKISNEAGQAIEHFGYADGISQPLFFEEDLKETTTRHWDPNAYLKLVLTPDFGCSDDNECFGSYLVYRKLEQDVKHFKEAEESLAAMLDYTGSADEAAGATVVGRFENGLPVLQFGSTAFPEMVSNSNDFNYSFDSNGSRCPYHAHIRKANPRGDTTRMFGTSEEEERSHRIVRRGITYDDRMAPYHNEPPSKDVGLLFMCFQAGIAEQFEHMQAVWLNNNDHPCPFTGIDPITGQGENRQKTNHDTLEQRWRNAAGDLLPLSFSGFVNMKGGEYFFAPSLPFFKKMASGRNA